MTAQISLPEILLIPPKLMPIITDFNHYKYFLIEGGRGSSKTQSVGRILLYIAEQVKARIFCGREVQNTIEESVHAVLADHINASNLAFRTRLNGIRHLMTGSTFKFKGFQEKGAVNIKGIEGADIIWVDEAQSITKRTLDTIIPTIRKNNCRVIFTMNRYMRDDAVVEELAGRDDCLHIKINYHENPYCPLTLKDEAERMRIKDEKSYRHVWLGEPYSTADDYLFNFDKLHNAFEVKPFGEIFGRQRVMGIDFAAQGNDSCVATILDRKSNQHWQVTEQIAWGEPDTMISVGKIIAMIGEHKPDIIILDVGGMGHVVWNRLNEVLAKTKNQVHRFDGATTKGVDSVHYANARAEGFWILKDWFDQNFLCIDRKDMEIVKQLEKIKMKHRSDGKRIIESKVDMKKELTYSPDNADSLMMAVYGAVKFLGRSATSQAHDNVIVRKSGSKRKR